MARPGALADRDGDFCETALNSFNVLPEISKENLARIPREGAVVVIANRPFGGLGCLVLASVLHSVRTDIKVVAERWLEHVSETERPFFHPDPLRKDPAGREALEECIRWLRRGGVLALFPACQISGIKLRRKAVADPEWRSGLAKIIRQTEASALPIFFTGHNDALFQRLGLVCRRFSSLVLRRKYLNHRRKEINVRVGSLIPFAKLDNFDSDKDMIAYLRMRTYILNSRTLGEPPGTGGHAASHVRESDFEEIAQPRNLERMAEEVRHLPPEQTLAQTGELTVIQASASQIPVLLHELGRLRETTFRQVGEGTGKSLDLDRFDRHYDHLFVWNAEKKELVGAYRLGPTDRILEHFGKPGLYTSTLFDFKPGMLRKINPALELGRSFVRAEYQKTYAPLMLLWKGIGQFVLKNPRYKILFGPVSINRRYNSTSRQLMIQFLKANNYWRDLAKLVKAKTPLKKMPIKGYDAKATGSLPASVQDLSTLVADIEADQKGVPILLKQYLKLGGRLLGCNIDANFSNVLDALLLIDLTRTDHKILVRYMGKKQAGEFLAYHGKSLELPSASSATITQR